MSETNNDHEHEFFSQCCGVKEREIEGLCPKCRDWTGFECDCGLFSGDRKP